MKVAYLSSVLTGHDFRFLSKLVERKHDATLVSYFPANLPAWVHTLPGLRVVHRPLRGPRALRPVLYPMQVEHLRGVLAALRPDVLHSGYVWKDGLVAALSRFHPHLSMPWGSDVLLEPQRNPLVRAAVKHVLRQADAITCDAEIVSRTIQTLSGVGPDKITVFPWGVELDRFRPDAARRKKIRARLGLGEAPVAIMTRSFRPVYAVEDFVRAMPTVLQRVPDAKALLLGDGPLEGALRAQVAALGLADSVRFVGAVRLDEMPGYLNAADLYVSCSLSDGTSLSLVEAMACGLPAVVTQVPAILEWITEGAGGRVVPFRSPARLGQAVADLLADPARRSEMGARNLSTAQARADWERNIDKLEGIYRALAGPRSKVRSAA